MNASPSMCCQFVLLDSVKAGLERRGMLPSSSDLVYSSTSSSTATPRDFDTSVTATPRELDTNNTTTAATNTPVPLSTPATRRRPRHTTTLHARASSTMRLPALAPAAMAAAVTAAAMPPPPPGGSSPVATTYPLRRWETVGDEQYSLRLSVGGQQLDVVVDTGSPDLWVLSECAEAAECANVPLYDSSRAVRSGQAFDAEYGEGSASGEIVTDVVGLLGGVGSFGMVNATSEWKAANTTLSGLLGLGLPYDDEDEDPLWLQSVPAWPEPLFGVHLGRRGAASGGAITFGGVDRAAVSGEINYLPLVSAHDWAVTLDSVSVQGHNLPTNARASVDTGTSHILAPRDAFEAFYAAIPGAFLHRAVPLFPCDAALDVALRLGGQSYPVDRTDLAIATYTPAELRAFGVAVDNDGVDRWCEGAVRLNDGDDWILGDAFLKNVYTVFRAHPPSVGFVRLSADADAGHHGVSVLGLIGGGLDHWPPQLAAAAHRGTMLAAIALLAVFAFGARLHPIKHLV
ncbi:Pregnancy-associated glycoprotein [Vanrija pseudolonga]|uniref:Pregnancy-associated glycoprotein n=1 Tax=Vanrija pseudolonga TaxID=143232 RepID=A0AAF1BKN3_9TREE|nr:Pregnancy-associated glycoprotein [Vanrija pseudolonga]